MHIEHTVRIGAQANVWRQGEKVVYKAPPNVAVNPLKAKHPKHREVKPLPENER